MSVRMTLENKKQSRLLFVACFVVYAASYVGRVNYSAALASIVGDGLFTKSQIGIVGSVFFFCYGSCQILWGVLGDKVSPFRMITVGLIGSALSNLCFPMFLSLSSMAVFWGLNGVFCSMLWSPVLRILANMLDKNMRARACLNISASLPVGTVLAYLISTVLIKYADWRYVFAAASVVLVAALLFFLFSYRTVKPYFVQDAAAQSVPVSLPSSHGSIKLLPLFLTSGLMFAIIPTLLHGMLKEGVTAWVPTMLSETYTVSASFSVLLSVFLPLVNVMGAYIINPIYKRLMKRNELSTAAVCMAVACIPLILLMFMAKLPPVVCVLLLAMCTMTMHAFNYMLITLVPVRFARFGKTATVTGILNASAYAGCATSTYGFGFIADKLGWQQTVIVWLVIVVAAGMFCVALSKKWKSFCTKMEEKPEYERV